MEGERWQEEGGWVPGEVGLASEVVWDESEGGGDEEPDVVGVGVRGGEAAPDQGAGEVEDRAGGLEKEEGLAGG